MNLNKYIFAVVIILALTIACAEKMGGKSGKAEGKMKKMKHGMSKSKKPTKMMEDAKSKSAMDSTTTLPPPENVEEEVDMMEKEMDKEMDKEMEEEGTKKSSVKNFKCQFTGALLEMRNSIKELDHDIKAIKNQMFEKCPGFEVPDVPEEGGQEHHGNNDGGSSGDKTELEDEESSGKEVAEGGAKEETTELPPIPGNCPEPFHPVASGCFYFLYYNQDWKTWGDASAHCQTIGGSLAAPYRLKDLRDYLTENFSTVFWVGAKESSGSFSWLTGTPLAPSDWRKGQPSKSAAKFCVYLEFFSGYKAVNHYCGEKFAFICEKRE